MKEKLLSLLDALSDQRRTLIVPTPALAEALCVATPAEQLLSELSSYACIEPFPFDQKAAIVLSEITKQNRSDVRKLRDDSTRPWQFLKMDMQIVAVAAANGADTMYTDDNDQTKFAELAGLNVLHTWNLSLSAKYAQTSLFKDGSNDEEKT